jgi:signal peptidase I
MGRWTGRAYNLGVEGPEQARLAPAATQISASIPQSTHRVYSREADIEARRVFRDIAETVITAVIIFVALQLTTQSRIIEGASMFPTLTSGERLLVNRFVYARAESGPLKPIAGDDGFIFHGPQRGDIVIFHPPGGYDTDFVKRIVAVPGDTVDIRNGAVYVNGVKEEYTLQTTNALGGQYPRTVPEGQYFVLGDNRRVSNDSRSWGFVQAEGVLGRAWFGYWPLRSIRVFG